MELTALYLLLVFMGILVVKHFAFWQPMDVTYLYRNGYDKLGHRGSPKEAPENTLPSYRKALEQGLKAIEMDVLTTRDGKVVCSHNHDLEHETDGTGYIDDMTYAELASVDAAAKFPDYSPCRLPLLEETLDAIPENVILDIEIKARGALDLTTAKHVVALIRKRNIYHRVVVSSFHPLVIGRVKWLDRRIPTGYIWTDHSVPVILRKPRFINLVHPDVFKPEIHLVNEHLVRYARGKKLSISPWTVNNQPAMEWSLNLGVQGIISDFPGLMHRAVENVKEFHEDR
ncbi:MAG: glycerophosphodiester phosphodiesterase family protein [Candidatus Neomarinimicrobiota bacterium]